MMSMTRLLTGLSAVALLAGAALPAVAETPAAPAATAAPAPAATQAAEPSGIGMLTVFEELFWGDAGIALSILGTGLAAAAWARRWVC